MLQAQNFTQNKIAKLSHRRNAGFQDFAKYSTETSEVWTIFTKLAFESLLKTGFENFVSFG